jgi:ankyrin repeat protein
VEGGTLLHVAAEFGGVEAAALLLDRGADPDAAAPVDATGLGGHTAIFHAVSQYDDAGLEAARLLIARGASLAVRVTLPGDYDQPAERVTCTPLGYALRFGGGPDRPTVRLLRESGAPE